MVIKVQFCPQSKYFHVYLVYALCTRAVGSVVDSVESNTGYKQIIHITHGTHLGYNLTHTIGAIP